ncbi:response regulator transcription factor [Exiguobacterium sp. K1]|uniref:response regulator transcription factor n=1 Tax=Exiguobacterium sp. K1 TaxID=2980105 RepID=UPI00299F288E|nr:response regulator transcription factor [Exiguobacterium sp. K1]MDX1260194.1 response regulator transcription factor [Exiguobacterium sp. K1]
MRILIAEDDKRLAKMLRLHLERAGYQVDVAHDGLEAIEQCQTFRYDLLVLDWMMPHKSGIEVATELRKERFEGGILMLTARDTEIDLVHGLDSGADDYLVKPFQANELLARLRALSRRQKKAFVSTVSYQELELDIATQTISYAGQLLELTRREFEFLSLLLRRPEQVMGRELIIEVVWGIGADITDNALDALVRLVRKKLDASGAPALIQTVRGFGYRLGGPHA